MTTETKPLYHVMLTEAEILLYLHLLHSADFTNWKTDTDEVCLRKEISKLNKIYISQNNPNANTNKPIH